MPRKKRQNSKSKVVRPTVGFNIRPDRTGYKISAQNPEALGLSKAVTRFSNPKDALKAQTKAIQTGVASGARVRVRSFDAKGKLVFSRMYRLGAGGKIIESDVKGKGEGKIRAHQARREKLETYLASRRKRKGAKRLKKSAMKLRAVKMPGKRGRPAKPGAKPRPAPSGRGRGDSDYTRFLKANAGKGYSLAQLRKMWHKHKGGKGASGSNKGGSGSKKGAAGSKKGKVSWLEFVAEKRKDGLSLKEIGALWRKLPASQKGKAAAHAASRRRRSSARHVATHSAARRRSRKSTRKSTRRSSRRSSRR